MKCIAANLTRVMKIEDLSLRKKKLQSMAMQICFHGDVWHKVMREIDRLNKSGVKTLMEQYFGSH